MQLYCPWLLPEFAALEKDSPIRLRPKTAPTLEELPAFVDTLADQLRSAIEASDLSQYEIAKRTGVDKGTLSKFMTGERGGISFESLEKLAPALGLKITARRTRKKAR